MTYKQWQLFFSAVLAFEFGCAIQFLLYIQCILNFHSVFTRLEMYTELFEAILIDLYINKWLKRAIIGDLIATNCIFIRFSRFLSIKNRFLYSKPLKRINMQLVAIKSTIFAYFSHLLMWKSVHMTSNNCIWNIVVKSIIYCFGIILILIYSLTYRFC